jgi:hypothetical protein
VVVIAAAVGAYFLLKGGSSTSNVPSAGAVVHPVAVTPSQLLSFAAKLGSPVYWRGAPTPGTTLELTRTREGIYVRYLPPGVAVGDPRPDFVTVGTYPMARAYDVAAAAGRARRSLVHVAGGGIVVPARDVRTSYYLAFAGSPYLIEVFAPNPLDARDIAQSGQVVPVS